MKGNCLAGIAGREGAREGRVDLAPEGPELPVAPPGPLGGALAPGQTYDIRQLASPYGGCLEVAFDSASGIRCLKLALTGSRHHDFLGSTTC